MNAGESLNLIQMILLVFVASLLLVALIATIRGRVSRVAGALWVVICLGGGAAVIWPGLTTRVARFLGIGRGTDLILYGTVVGMVLGFIMMYIRIRRLRRDITLLVRQIAIRDAAVTAETSESESAPPASGS
jgi:hypothetical protein